MQSPRVASSATAPLSMAETRCWDTPIASATSASVRDLGARRRAGCSRPATSYSPGRVMVCGGHTGLEQVGDVGKCHLDASVDAGVEQHGAVEVAAGRAERDRHGHRLEEAEQRPHPLCERGRRFVPRPDIWCCRKSMRRRCLARSSPTRCRSTWLSRRWPGASRTWRTLLTCWRNPSALSAGLEGVHGAPSVTGLRMPCGGWRGRLSRSSCPGGAGR